MALRDKQNIIFCADKDFAMPYPSDPTPPGGGNTAAGLRLVGHAIAAERALVFGVLAHLPLPKKFYKKFSRMPCSLITKAQ
jgi:hypothetical protein